MNGHPILTAIDIQSGMIVAIELTDKRMLFDYAVTQLQHFLIECGRTAHTILQSDQENFLTALITTVASKNGNITTRNSGAYSSQSQGGVERAHRTLFAQIRTLKAQIKQNYNRDIPMKHPLMPWIVRRSAYIMNRQLCTAMDAQATSTDGTENSIHHCASLVRQCNTCYQQ